MSKQDRIEPRKLKGFRDFLPAQALLRREIIDTIFKNALLAGFQAIDTPVLEYAETLLGSGGQETDKEVYRFKDHGDREVALRFDLTVPFARYVAENQAELIFPFKKVQIGNAWRGEKPQKGRYREFCQADLDIVGVDTLAADAEILFCILRNLESLVPETFTMAVGHRVILSALIKACLPQLDPEGEGRTLGCLDKLAKIGEAEVARLIGELAGSSEAGVNKLLKALSRRLPSGDSDLGAMRELIDDTAVHQEIERLQDTISLVRKLLHGQKATIRIDLSIARGLGYYTGIVFETSIDGLDGFGSIASGGRYNGLVSRFAKLEMPGIGGSIGVDRLLAALEQLNKVTVSSRLGIFVAVASELERAYAFELLLQLRDRGVMADIALKPGKFAQQFKYADKRNYAKVVTIGEEELKNLTLTIKDLHSGSESRDISFEEGLALLSIKGTA